MNGNSRVVVDWLVEDFGVADCHDPSGVLPALDPHGRIVAIRGVRLTHFHDGGLNKSQRNHVATHSAHANSVADVKCLSPQNHKIACGGGHHLLQRECEAGSYQSQGGRKTGRVVEPNRDEAHGQQDGCPQIDPLSRPKVDAGVTVSGQRPS